MRAGTGGCQTIPGVRTLEIGDYPRRRDRGRSAARGICVDLVALAGPTASG